MLGAVTISIALIVAAVLLLTLAMRTRKSANAIVRWGGSTVAIALATALFGVVVVAITGEYRLYRRASAPLLVTDTDSPKQFERGRAVADSLCSACHTKTGTLTGGMEFGRHSLAVMGSFTSSNLTPAGPLRGWSDAEIFQAIRNAVDPAGRRLVIMSLTNNGNLSDDDTQAVISYIRHLPASGSPTPDPPDRVSYVGRLMLGAGVFPPGAPVSTRVVTAPPKGPTYAYGEYILSYWDCRQCHGAKLTGGVRGQIGPIGPDLTVVKRWSPAQFIATLRTGRNPDGHTMGDEMPWRTIGKMDDEELRAVFEYLTQIPGTTSARNGGQSRTSDRL